MNRDDLIPLELVKHPFGCGCRPAENAAAPEPASDGAVTYEVTYDVYGPGGPASTTVTVAATSLDIGGEYVTLRRDRKVVFSVHRDRFATIWQVDPVQTVMQVDGAIEDVANRVEKLLLRRLNTAALGRP